MSDQRTLVIIQSPPSPDLEALDVILSLAAFETQVSVLFVGTGREWLHNSQHARLQSGKSPSKALAALSMYGCHDVYYLDDACVASQTPTTLAKPLSEQQCQQWITQHQHCLSF